jgi:V/A-type H+-transporting ATPase subunit I
MLFPREMTEVELIVPSKDLLAVTKALGSHGVFHELDSTYMGLENLGPSSWVERAASYSAAERRLQSILQTLNLAEDYSQQGSSESLADLQAILPVVERIEEEVRSTNDQLNAEKKRLEQLESQLRQLEPITDVNVDVGGLRHSNYLHSLLGVVPAANMSRMESSLSRVPHVLFTLREDPQKPVVWLMGPRANSDIIDRAAKSAFLDPLALPDEFLGTPAEITASLRRAIESSRQRIAELNAALAALGEQHKRELNELLGEVHVSRLVADAIVRFGQLRNTYVVVGWVPTDNLEALKQRLRQSSPEVLMETFPTQRSGYPSNVPVALQTNKWLRPFQMLVTTYGRPNYGELDPTWLMALTFPLLFGAMFGDFGQGLILLLGGILIHRRVILKSLSSLGLLIAYCGASAAIFGLLYGSLFGFEGHLIEEYLGFHFEAPWISPINEILPVLALSIDFGIVLLLLSFVLGMFNSARARDWPHLAFGHTGLVAFVFYIAFLALLGSFLGSTAIAPQIAVGISQIPLPFVAIAAIFGILVMFSGALRKWMEGHRPIEGRGVGGFMMFFVESFMDLFETVISLLSNTLSFVRVGAFAVAHGGLSLAIFALAGDEAGLGFWITIILGNLFIIGFEGLIVGIQTMRLHYYEILGKFFHGGGMRFEPLALSPEEERA